MSRTLARSEREEFFFISISFILLFMMMDLRVIGFPGRLMCRIHGSHCRNRVRTCKWVGNGNKYEHVCTAFASSQAND